MQNSMKARQAPKTLYNLEKNLSSPVKLYPELHSHAAHAARAPNMFGSFAARAHRLDSTWLSLLLIEPQINP